MMKTMNERIRELRKRIGLSQSQFALRINKTPGFISLVENGRSCFSDETIRDISEAFGVNELWLTEGKGEMFQAGRENTGSEKEEQGARVKMLRNKLGLSREQFALEVSCSRNQIYNIENKKSFPSENLLKKIADTFAISFEWLRDGTGTMDEGGGTPQSDAERIRQYMLKDSVARDVVLEAMKKDRSVWLMIDRVIRSGGER